MATPTHNHWQNDPAVAVAARNAPSFKQGASGSGVQRLREALMVIGAPPVVESLDQFGALTRAQIVSFQGLYQLDADGAAGKQTLGKLDELLWTPDKRKPWKQAAVNQDKEAFLQDVATQCGPVVRANGLPVSSMLACAAVESGWGNGQIFKDTKNLFSLQKWPWVPFPTTAQTLWRKTIIQTNPVKTALAPFNTATDLADAGRQWCEWITHYGDADGPPGNINKNARPASNAWAIGRRQQLLAMVDDPVRFASNLFLVSFGENARGGQIYARVLTDNRLTRFD